MRWGVIQPRARRARALRRDATEAEKTLWQALRALSLPVKVRRQHPIGRYVVDFAVPACKLVIEIDGGQHAAALERDVARSRALQTHGYRVIRFWNSDVTSNLSGILETIVAEIGCSPTSPRPSPPRGEERENPPDPRSAPPPTGSSA